MSDRDRVYLIVGLGNPGRIYQGTRHNIGKDFVKWLGKFWRVPLKNREHLFVWGEKREEEKRIMLIYLRTFMNESGRAFPAMIKKFSPHTEDIMVVHDDLDIPLGRIKILKEGGTGGHRGIESIQETLRTKKFPRIRVGIGKPPPGMRGEEYVLGRLGREEKEEIRQLFPRIEEAIRTWMERGIDIAMSIFNRREVKR